MSNTTQQLPVLGRITSLLEEIGNEKQASELGTSGSAAKDPGGYQGGSSHPSAKADGDVQSAPMGSRAKENESDVKADDPVNTDQTSPESGGDQDSKQLNIGTQQSATGEDSSVEDDYKGSKDDPGTTHPMNAEDTGDKYASWNFDQLTKTAYARMNEVLADLSNGTYLHNLTVQPAAGEQDETKLAAEAGYELADVVGQMGDPGSEEITKNAFAELVVEQTILDAERDADRVGEYLAKYAFEKDRLLKEGMMPPEGGGGELPPDALAAMAGGGAGGPEGMPMPDEGGGDIPVEETGEPPMDTDLGDGGEGGELGGELGGGGEMAGDEESLNELANALIEAGIPPEELLEAVSEEAGGGGGGGEEPMEMKEARAILGNMATSVQEHARAGKFRYKEAAPGSPARVARDEVIGYVREFCGRK